MNKALKIPENRYPAIEKPGMLEISLLYKRLITGSFGSDISFQRYTNFILVTRCGNSIFCVTMRTLYSVEKKGNSALNKRLQRDARKTVA